MRHIFILASLVFVGCAETAPMKVPSDSFAQPYVLTASGSKLSTEAIDAFVDAQMQALNMPGLSLAVFQNGEIVYEAAKGVANLETGEPITSESVFEAASLSKPVFALLVLGLVDEGILELDRPLYEYLPFDELEMDGRYRNVTARMVLSHQTGFPNWRWFDPAPEELAIKRGTMYQKDDPGVFTYSGEGYTYLSKVLAQLLGHDLSTLDVVYQERVASRLNLSCSSFVRTECVGERKVTGHREGAVSDDGWPRSFPDDTPETFGAAGRLHTNATDYANIAIAMADGRTLSEGLYNQMLSAQTDLPPNSETTRLTGQTSWGLGIAMEPTPYGTRYEHGGNNGGFQSGMMFYTDTGLGYVFLTNSDTGAAFGQCLETLISEGE